MRDQQWIEDSIGESLAPEFVTWLSVYDPDWALAYSGDVKGMYAAWKAGRDADHCTPEERAVIEAAVRDHESETHPEGESRNVGFDRMVQARREFRLAVTELLAARARKGEVDDGRA